MHYYSYLFVFRYTTTINYTTFVRTLSVPDGVKHIKPPWLGQLYSEILGWICVPSQNFQWYSATNFLWRAKAATEITRQAPIPSQCPVKLPSLPRLMDLMNPIARLPARGTDSLRQSDIDLFKAGKSQGNHCETHCFRFWRQKTVPFQVVPLVEVSPAFWIPPRWICWSVLIRKSRQDEFSWILWLCQKGTPKSSIFGLEHHIPPIKTAKWIQIDPPCLETPNYILVRS